MTKRTIILASMLGLAMTAPLEAAAAPKQRPPASPRHHDSRMLQTRDVSADAAWQSRQRVYRDIARYDSAPLITGGGY